MSRSLESLARAGLCLHQSWVLPGPSPGRKFPGGKRVRRTFAFGFGDPLEARLPVPFSFAGGGPGGGLGGGTLGGLGPRGGGGGSPLDPDAAPSHGGKSAWKALRRSSC